MSEYNDYKKDLEDRFQNYWELVKDSKVFDGIMLDPKHGLGHQPVFKREDANKNVIVNERRQMNQLDHHSHDPVPLGDAARGASGEQRESGTKTFAGAVQQVLDGGTDVRLKPADLFGQYPFDLFQVSGNRAEQLQQVESLEIGHP